MTAETWLILWMGYAFLGPMTGFRPLPQLWDMLFITKRLEDCHKAKITSAWGDFMNCDQCGKSPNNWRHWPKRMEPHEFKPHIRRDIGTPIKSCDLCNKRNHHISHTNYKRGLFGSFKHADFVAKAWTQEALIERRVLELEKWHDDFRLRHPELEDKVRNDLFPELRPKDPDVHEMMSEEEMNYRLGMGL